MENRILAAYPDAVFVGQAGVDIYLTDFSERTHKTRGVEVSSAQPDVPGKADDLMDCLHIHNKAAINITFNIFDDHQFKDEANNDIEHCECCFFPTDNNETTFVGFVEIKDCKPRNVAEYREKAKKQIIRTVRLFRERHILTRQRVYGIISFPRKKAAFDQTIFCDYTEYKKWYKEEKIRFIPGNDICVKDANTLEAMK